MRSTVTAMATLLLLTSSLGVAQTAPQATSSERKVTSRVAPNYPELAKKMHLQGRGQGGSSRPDERDG